MGAGIALALAAERPDLVKAVIALEAPLRPRGRRNPFLTHAKVNGGWHSAAYVRGLMSPTSPAEDRRRAAHIYAQGAPGIYDGDLVFYSDEFDGEVVAKRIDGRRIPVALLIGHYDFSATVSDAHALAGWIECAVVTEMPELGHFPMTENPAVLLKYLRPILAALSSSA
jgi:pimeloyl-ACP methyl ester carboxylesterase